MFTQIFTPSNVQLVKRFFIHAGLLALGVVFMYIEQLIAGHNFGIYQGVVTAGNAIVLTGVEKFFGDQGVPLLVPSGSAAVQGGTLTPSTNSSIAGN